MNSSDQNPKLPTWLFIATDVVFIGVATVIALRSQHPLSNQAIFWIVACVGVGALILLVPLVTRYERQKNEALDERQTALEALARTITSSAEQISIAANGLHEVAELAQKNLRLAEHLPHKLQDKIAEFQAQLTAANETDKEEIERELLALRTSESERLDTVSQRIAKSSAEWSKLEAATQQHLTAANEAVAKLAFGTASAIGKAQAAAEQALSQARIEAARSLGETSGNATRAIESAKNAALAELDAKLTTGATTIVERITRELDTKLARLTSASAVAAVVTSSSAESSVTTASPAQEPAATDPGSAPHVEVAAAKSDMLTQPPKRPRKVRREETISVEPTSAASGATPSADVARTNPPTVSAPETPPAAPPAEEPQPIPANTIEEITPAVPDTAEPFSGHIATVPNGVPPPPANSPEVAESSPEAAKSARKRVTKKTEDDEPSLGLEIDESSSGSPGPIGERGVTSDGATRLLVTAYIGIGNRLFIRGHGPGLSWEKGAPLQFVSIGKWRWETNDASAPIEFKLYKNDDTECSALGTQSLDPGHQQELTATF